MRVATLPYRDSTSAAVLFEDGTCGLVRALAGREDGFDAAALIAAPLTDDEVAALSRSSQPLDENGFLAPVSPPKNVLCVGKNYLAHAIEGSRAEGLARPDIPTAPIWFTKAHTSLIGHGAAIVPPPGFDACLDYEGELAIVIGARARNLTAERAMDAVFGYTVFNDVTARDIQQGRKQWFRGKSADTFGPIGPWIVTAEEVPDPQSLTITTSVNDEIRQHDNTANMIFSIRDLLVDISAGLTLEPGDVIATGTPEGVAWGMDEPRYLNAGDQVSVEIAGIGSLVNTVAA